MTLTVTINLLLINFNIGHNFFILKDGDFIFGMCIPYIKAFLMVPYIFEHMTFTFTFDPPLENFNIGHNSLVIRCRVFKFCMYVPNDQVFLQLHIL